MLRARATFAEASARRHPNTVTNAQRVRSPLRSRDEELRSSRDPDNQGTSARSSPFTAGVLLYCSNAQRRAGNIHGGKEGQMREETLCVGRNSPETLALSVKGELRRVVNS